MYMKQTWQKRYLVLRDSWTEESDTSLELYACSDSGKCHTVSLRHVMLVHVYHDSKSFPHAFIVFRSVNCCFLFSIHNCSQDKPLCQPLFTRCTVYMQRGIDDCRANEPSVRFPSNEWIVTKTTSVLPTFYTI